ncbi:LacI family DNA-binding transcriptional regulator [Streptomyces violaceusniger]|uniref:LacI family DNA-binding transcriptional regulator n=1 Tax=Streptomyces violaceusniger TaxID=68280 RepID=UPI003444840E
MSDVAARVGVSQALVSLVFRNQPGASSETRRRVFQAAEELGYRPDTAAQLLRRTRSRQLGVLFTVRQPHDVGIVEALYPAAQKHGYTLVLNAMFATRDERQGVEELLGLRSEAIITIGATSSRQHLTTGVGRTPIVEISPRTRTAGVDVVRTAERKGMGQAVDHLVTLGHRAITHIEGGAMPGADERRRGYRAAMRRHGLADHIRVHPGDYTEESGAQAARDLLALPELPTAVIAGNDRCAHGLLGTFLRAGVRVPDDVSVVGYDDSQLARLSFIDLTSVRQDAAEAAETAVRAAVERLDEGRTADRDIVLNPTLVVRGSTGPPRTLSTPHGDPLR